MVACLVFANDATGGEAGDAREPFQVEQGAHGASGAFACRCRFCGGVLEALGGAVERGP
jgi:hypothetical protein